MSGDDSAQSSIAAQPAGRHLGVVVEQHEPSAARGGGGAIHAAQVADVALVVNDPRAAHALEQTFRLGVRVIVDQHHLVCDAARVVANRAQACAASGRRASRAESPARRSGARSRGTRSARPARSPAGSRQLAGEAAGERPLTAPAGDAQRSSEQPRATRSLSAERRVERARAASGTPARSPTRRPVAPACAPRRAAPVLSPRLRAAPRQRAWCRRASARSAQLFALRDDSFLAVLDASLDQPPCARSAGRRDGGARARAHRCIPASRCCACSSSPSTAAVSRSLSRTSSIAQSASVELAGTVGQSRLRCERDAIQRGRSIRRPAIRRRSAR